MKAHRKARWASLINKLLAKIPVCDYNCYSEYFVIEGQRVSPICGKGFLIRLS